MAAMTKTFRYPPSVAGAGVDPTLAQMIGRNRVVVDIASDAAGANEDPVTVDHNMACPTANGSDGSPEVSIAVLVPDAAMTGLRYAYTNANRLTFTKIIQGGGNTAFTWRVLIERPHSIGL